MYNISGVIIRDAGDVQEAAGGITEQREGVWVASLQMSRKALSEQGHYVIQKSRRPLNLLNTSQRYMVPNELQLRDFPGDVVVKNPPANTGDTGSSPGLGRCHMLRSNKPVHHNY